MLALYRTKTLAMYCTQCTYTPVFCIGNKAKCMSGVGGGEVILTLPCENFEFDGAL